jgi:hypothetical protein
VSLTLFLGKRELQCRGGSVSINVQTERWVERKLGPIRLPGRWEYDPSLAYTIIELEVEVDEHSGGDGEPAPRLEIEIPPVCWRVPLIGAMAGTIWQNGGGTKIVGWYGNDAPEIEGSAVSFGSWSDGQHLLVDWTGSFRWRRGDSGETFRLVGPVKFTGLHMSVKDKADVGRFLAAALPGFRMDGLDLLKVETTDFGPEMPDQSRRHWEGHHWTRKQVT